MGNIFRKSNSNSGGISSGSRSIYPKDGSGGVTREEVKSSSGRYGLPFSFTSFRSFLPSFSSRFQGSNSLSETPCAVLSSSNTSAAAIRTVKSSSRSGYKTKTNKYDFIPDKFSSIDQVTAALRESGLESSNLILGIDFTKSNEWTGRLSFNNQSLHAIGDAPNPYEKAITIIGKTLAPFDEDNLIPCFGFGDATTHDEAIFSFHTDHSPCHGFEEVLSCYRRITPNIQLSGPTSYSPVVDAAINIVERSGGQYHVLVIIADGQVTRSVNTREGELSPQEKKTIDSIVNASLYPLSIVLVGVGDGPWEDMRKFDDKVPARKFDNFQFVNFTTIMSKIESSSKRESAFALAALMEVPIQYIAVADLGLLGHVTGRAKVVVPRPPPVPYVRSASHLQDPLGVSASTPDERNQLCPICLSNKKDMAFGCGHTTCKECGERLSTCPICRAQITNRLRLYT